MCCWGLGRGRLRRGRIRRRPPARQRALLRSRGQCEQGTEHALAHDRPRQRVAQRGDGVDDLGGEIAQPQDLRHPRPGDPELAREGGPRRALPIIQVALPFLRQDNRIAVLLGGARWPCRRVEESGRLCAFEMVGQPRGSPRRQRDADEECEIERGSSGFAPASGSEFHAGSLSAKPVGSPMLAPRAFLLPSGLAAPPAL